MAVAARERFWGLLARWGLGKGPKSEGLLPKDGCGTMAMSLQEEDRGGHVAGAGMCSVQRAGKMRAWGACLWCKGAGKGRACLQCKGEGMGRACLQAKGWACGGHVFSVKGRECLKCKEAGKG